MPNPLPKRHYQTFARLHPASPADVAALVDFERHFSGGAAKLDWARLVTSQAAVVVTAYEGDCLVGAAVLLHRGEAATARLVWIGVCPSARSRGVGALLLDAAVSAVRDSGAAVAVAEVPAGQTHLSRLLLSGGFQCRATTPEIARYKRLLWPRREAGDVIHLSFA
jgi:GNAT superfamily N-acetyltransferase